MKKNIVGLLIVLCCCSSVFAEEAGVKLLCRPVHDSIMLRWAPTDKQTWDLGNKYGYMVERYTILRNGQLSDDRQAVALTAAPQKPALLAAWEKYADDRYAAIAAQCIFGEVEALSALSPVAVAKRYKQEQNRFAMAMYAADQSVLAARLSGLYLADKTVQADEKYLYRVYVATPDTLLAVDTAFAFTGLSEYRPLPPPIELSAQWDNKKVILSWNILYQNHIYNSYMVEKSQDGKRYEFISENATVQAADPGVVPTHAYRSDSLNNNETTWYYRVRGIDAFGELSPPSDSVVGRGRIPITEAPVITDKEVRDNKEVHLTWNYPEEMNGYISGFRVYRSPNPNGLKQKVYESKAPSERTFTDVSPDITNYYIMSVFNEETEKVSKSITYAELIDSIPPLKPVGFAGTIDSTGKVWLRWKPNTDKDLDGYRVYRSNHPDFEFLLITSSVLKDTTYTDSVTLKTLTQQVYYRLRAIDLRQNQSEFGEVLALRRPDIIPPVAPLIVSAEVKKGMVVLTWINSTSEDVARHHIYRRQKDDTTFHLLADIAKTSEEQSTYEDRTITPGEVYVYQVKAEDQSGLYSTPSSPVQRKALGGLVEQVVLKKKQQLANRVVLIWEIKSEKKVERVLVYKAYGDADLQLYGNATGNTYTDENLLPETTARYSIKAIYVDGTSSALSNEVVVKM